jgi:hypothetical protein
MNRRSLLRSASAGLVLAGGCAGRLRPANPKLSKQYGCPRIEGVDTVRCTPEAKTEGPAYLEPRRRTLAVDADSLMVRLVNGIESDVGFEDRPLMLYEHGEESEEWRLLSDPEGEFLARVLHPGDTTEFALQLSSGGTVPEGVSETYPFQIERPGIYAVGMRVDADIEGDEAVGLATLFELE